METLFGVAPAAEPAPLQPASQSEYRRPGVAFVLSLLLPGAGHVYCRKRNAGIATFAFFAACALSVATLRLDNPFWGVAFRAGLVLYAFAFLDAFYTAREINSGMAQYIVGYNPRIASMLNLVTNGFGYFYLGERTKGVAVFLGIRVISAFAQRATGAARHPMMIAVELLLAFLAADAYRLARKQMREAFPDANLDPFAAEQGLSAAVPAGLAAIFLLNYVLLVVVGLTMPSYKTIDQSTAVTRQDSTDTIYSNPVYRVSISFPQEWIAQNGHENGSFVTAKRFSGACSVQLMAQPRLPIVSAQSFAGSLRKELENNHAGFKWISDIPATLGPLRGTQVSFMVKVGEGEVRQNYIVAPSGLSMYALVETAGAAFLDDCAGDFDQIRDSVHVR